MKKTFLFAAALLLGAGVSLSAQETSQSDNLPMYQRSSLHMILLRTDEPLLADGQDFSSLITEAWSNYPFPDKYNQHAIPFTEAYGGAPKGSLMEILHTFRGKKVEDWGIDDVVLLQQKLSKNKEYNDQLVAATQGIISDQKIGNQLMKKWFNIQPDGSWDWNLLSERALYNASQSAVAEAEATVAGIRKIMDDGENLIANTFVTFSKLAFYETEPVSALTRDLAYVVASQVPEPARTIAVTSANVAYAATKRGYTAETTTALYKLDWNEDVQAAFYAMFKEDGKIDMAAFDAYEFPMSLVGIDKANSNTIDALGGLSQALGVDDVIKDFGGKGLAKDLSDLFQQTIIRNIDKILAVMGKNYEVFAPVSQIISVNPIVADLGMKEGLKGGEKFDLLEPVVDPQTGAVEWKSIGQLSVSKGKLWDNRYALTDDAKAAADKAAVKGSVLTPNNKKAAVGMVVKQVVKKKK